MTDQEMNDLVAEKVMGWVKGEHPEKNGTGQWFSEYGQPVYFHDNGYTCSWEWSPVDSIEAAWPVFCKFTSRFLWYDDATDTWHCHLDSTRRVMGDCRYHATSEDETGAEAICKAALQAMGVEVA